MMSIDVGAAPDVFGSPARGVGLAIRVGGPAPRAGSGRWAVLSARRGWPAGAAVAAMLIALLAAGALPAPAGAEEGGEATSLTGEVLDAACYMAHGRKGAGPSHRQCAVECIKKKNLPIGLLTANDEVVLVVPDHADEKPYEALKDKAAATVTVEGRLVTRGGMKALIVTAVK